MRVVICDGSFNEIGLALVVLGLFKLIEKQNVGLEIDGAGGLTLFTSRFDSSTQLIICRFTFVNRVYYWLSRDLVMRVTP